MNQSADMATTATPDVSSEAQRLAIQALFARGLDIPLDEASRQEFAAEFNRLPAMEFMGCELDLADARVVRVALPEVQAHHQGGMGMEAVNGAVVAGLADCALGVAGLMQFPGQRSGTVEMGIKFLRPTIGRSVTAYAVALKRSPSVVFAEIELYAEGTLCAIATGMVAPASSGVGA